MIQNSDPAGPRKRPNSIYIQVPETLEVQMKKKLKPVIKLLAEAAVDDALKKAEKFPNTKRARLSRDAARQGLDEDANDQD